MRTWFLPVVSIESLMSIVGCKDSDLEESLLSALNQEWIDDIGTIDPDQMGELGREEYEESVGRIKKLVNGASVELGSWAPLLESIARDRALIPEFEFPFEDGCWSQIEVWKDYIKYLQSISGTTAIELLRHLEMGRPLKGTSMDCDGLLFSWLSHAEIAVLQQALGSVGTEDNEQLLEFHDQLVGTLAICNENHWDLFMGAS